MIPPFSWSRQHLRLSTSIKYPQRVSPVIETLPIWGKWWIATPLWKWHSTPSSTGHIRFVGVPLFLGRMRLDIHWTNTTPSTLTMTMIFDPNGPIGLVYWLALWPIHRVVFPLLLHSISKRTVPSQ